MIQIKMGQTMRGSASLAALTTRKASLQTYYTIRLLVDRDRVDNAYRAYGYFRWVDDQIDQGALGTDERTQFIQRQAALVDECFDGGPLGEVTPEEAMLVELIRSDASRNSGLAAYIRNLMSVMAFDAVRRGRLISQSELKTYTDSLAVAVTEAIHYFIGHDQFAPHEGSRYLAVAAAHITHMLRDTREDIDSGYFNIPREFLEARHISEIGIGSPAQREWVRGRVKLAREYFRSARTFVARVESRRCRLAYWAYMARFETVLDVIERDGWLLRPAYRERKSPRNALRMGWSIVLSGLGSRIPDPGTGILRLR